MQSPLPTGDARAVVFATTADGLKLPVIDVTHPAFAVPDDPASLAARRDAFLAWDRRNRHMPSIVMRLLTRLGARRSPLLRMILASENEYLDSINALIMLARAHATLIRRPIAIHVLDAQQDGPTFGARALLALTAPGGPLHGLEVQFQHHAYDWNDTAPLAR